MLFKGWVFALLCVKVVSGATGEGKEIADRLGDDLSFASKQVIRGFTSIFAPFLESAQSIPRMITKVVPMAGAIPGSPISESNQNFQNVVLRDGINAFGKGVKAGATILSTPARVVGTGLEEFRKVGQASADARFGAADNTPTGAKPMDDRTKIASTLLNTTSSQLSQANLGAVLLEVAMKNRVKDMANKTAEVVVPKTARQVPDIMLQKRQTVLTRRQAVDVPTTTTRTDVLLGQFNEAVRRNNERLLEALKSVISVIDPTKNKV